MAAYQPYMVWSGRKSLCGFISDWMGEYHCWEGARYYGWEFLRVRGWVRGVHKLQRPPLSPTSLAESTHNNTRTTGGYWARLRFLA